ncbi:MAG TPA: hypothetical protein VII56_19385 [Rhizomicrobium sp.]
MAARIAEQECAEQRLLGTQGRRRCRVVWIAVDDEGKRDEAIDDGV